jgi:hypothetical protein
MPHAQAVADMRRRLLAGDRAQQRVEVQRRRAAVVAEPARPLLGRTIGGELDPDAVGVGQVDRLVRAVVGGALHRRLRDRQPLRRARELLPARIQQRVVVEPRVAAGRTSLRILVEHHDRLDAVAELGLRRVVAEHAQTEGALVPGDGSVDVGDGQVDGAEAQRRGEPHVGCAAGTSLDRGHAHRVPAPRSAGYGGAWRMYGGPGTTAPTRRRRPVGDRASARGRPSAPRRGGA